MTTAAAAAAAATAVADFENNSRQKNRITIILLKLIHPNRFNEYFLMYNVRLLVKKNGTLCKKILKDAYFLLNAGSPTERPKEKLYYMNN